MNYFSLFGLPVHYQIDIQLLRSLFQDLQRKNHPDNFIRSDKSAMKTAIYKSSLINQAWHTLRNPIKRAEYLLSLHGFNDCTNEQNTLKDNEFLIEQFKLRKKLEYIEQKKDKAQLDIFLKYVKDMLNVYYKTIEEQLSKKNWHASSCTIQKIRFFNTLKNNAEQLEEKLLNF